jgi:hypothetical protein
MYEMVPVNWDDESILRAADPLLDVVRLALVAECGQVSYRFFRTEEKITQENQKL